MDGDPLPVEAAQRELRGADGALLQRGVEHVGGDALGREEPAGLLAFGDPLLREVDVDPSGEQVREVPLALAVAQQDQRGHGREPMTQASSP